MENGAQGRPKSRDWRERRKASTQVYFRSEAEKAHFQALAEAAGYTTFNQWILQMLANATSGSVYPAEYVAGLQEDVRKYRAWVEQKDQEIAELRRDLKVCETQREDLRVVLAGLTTDPAVLARITPRREGR